MSLFGSIYDDAGDEANAPLPEPAPAADPAGAPTDAPPTSIEAAIEVPLEPAAAAPGPQDPASAVVAPPAAAPLSGPTMSLQDFAAEVFGSGGAAPVAEAGPAVNGDASNDQAGGSPAEHEPPEAPAEPTVPTLPSSPFASFETDPTPPAGAVEAAAEPGAVATLTEPAPEPTGEDDLPGLAETPEALAGFEPPVEVGSFDDIVANFDADLLPARKPRRGRGGAPSVSLPAFGRPVKLVAVLLVIGFAGFAGLRLVGGGGGTSEAAENPATAQAGGALGSVPVAGALDPRDVGSILSSVELVSAEADLRVAAVAAQAHYAETGTFDAPASEWSSMLGRTVTEAGGATAPAPGVLQVTSSAAAVCFELRTESGASAAVGITDSAQGFASDPAGAGVCVADPAVIAGWASSLVTL